MRSFKRIIPCRNLSSKYKYWNVTYNYLVNRTPLVRTDFWYLLKHKFYQCFGLTPNVDYIKMYIHKRVGVHAYFPVIAVPSFLANVSDNPYGSFDRAAFMLFSNSTKWAESAFVDDRSCWRRNMFCLRVRIMSVEECDHILHQSRTRILKLHCHNFLFFEAQKELIFVASYFILCLRFVSVFIWIYKF